MLFSTGLCELSGKIIRPMKEFKANRQDRRRTFSPSAAFYKRLLAQAPVGFIFAGPDLQIEYANDRAAAILASASDKELLGASVDGCVPLLKCGAVEKIRRCLDTGSPLRMRVLPGGGLSKSGTFEIRIEPVRNGRDQTAGLLLVFVDLSRARKTESRLQPTNRLESMGILADGIVRDFSNILWEIIGNTELGASEIEVGHPARYNLEQAIAACRRAQELIMRIVRFSRHSEPKKRPVKLSTLVGESLQQLSTEIPENVTVGSHISTDKDLILAQPSEILRMLAHLYRNSIQAMEEEGGDLEISLVDMHLEAEELYEHPGLIPGRYLLLTVMDSGPGMSGELLEHAFDPFFTGRSAEHHSGMGLAIVKSMARDQGGAVSLVSRPKNGTMVHLILPALEAAAAAIGPKETPLPHGMGTILLVDSDVSVLKMRGRMIRRLGYEVVAVENSREALARFEQAPEAYDLVLVDQSAADLPTTEVAERMKKLRKDVPILLCTGLSRPELEADAKAAGIDQLLIKPLRMKDLALTLREALSSSVIR